MNNISKCKKYIVTTIAEYVMLNEDVKLNENFWAWFGNSKTVDKNGNPMIFYHGSNVNRRFSSFKCDKPTWFTSYRGYAEAFISEDGKIFTVFLKIQNPLYIGNIDGVANDKNINYLAELTNINAKILKDILTITNGVNLFNITNSSRFKEIVESMGYDGLEAKEGNGLTTYAIFNPNQVKSAKNSGSWSTDNSNINL